MRFTALALSATAIAMLLLSLVAPWWQISYSYPEKPYSRYGLLYVCSLDFIWGNHCERLDQLPDEVANPLMNTALLVLGGVVACVSEVLLVARRRVGAWGSRWAVVPGVATVALTLAAPVYLATVLPGATRISYVRGFFGTTTLYPGVTASYGGDLGCGFGSGRVLWIPQLSGHGARADRDHWLHDGL